MTTDDPTPLAYASADPAALRPGERLLWEGGRRRSSWSFLGRDRRPAFRVTDRRAMCMAPQTRSDPHTRPVRLPIASAVVRHVGRPGRATLVVDPLRITGLSDCQSAARAVAAVPRPPRRRRRPHRSSPTMPIVVPTPGNVPSDLGLLDGEHVLWTGRPIIGGPPDWQAVRRQVTAVGLLLIPIAVLVGVTYPGINHMTAGQAVFALVAAAWLLLGGYAAVIAPGRNRRRLRRTTYTLTNRRAFVVGPDRGGRQVAFVFLDALPPTFVRHQSPDGRGDVKVAEPIAFERVADPAAVHSMLVDAVVSARLNLPDHGWPVETRSPSDA